MGERVPPPGENAKIPHGILKALKPSLLTQDEVQTIYNRDKCIQRLTAQIREIRAREFPKAPAIDKAWEKVAAAYVEYLKIRHAPAWANQEVLQLETQIQQRLMELQQVRESKHLTRIRGALGLKYLRMLSHSRVVGRSRRSRSPSEKPTETGSSPPPPSA